MKIAYITKHNPHEVHSWSGTNYNMFNSLVKQGLDVTHVGKSLWHWSKRLPQPLRKLTSLFSPKNQNNQDQDLIELSRYSAKLIETELKTKPYDIIFTPVSSKECALLNIDLPIVYLSDATSRLLKNYYPNRTSQPEKVAKQRDFLESQIIEKANALIYSSKWAADSAVTDYHVSKNKVNVIPFGANIQKIDDLDDILKYRRLDTEIKLLFIGSDWIRKGGEIAFNTVKQLNEMGIKARLIVCGATPPEKCQTEYVTVKGYLRKNQSKEFEELISLFRSCHFMFVPSRADCTPIVFCEASAYGLPVISTQTGGISSVVFEAENGYLLPLEAKAEKYANLIATIFQDQEKYMELVLSSRKVYEERLNWKQWAKKVSSVLESLV